MRVAAGLHKFAYLLILPHSELDGKQSAGLFDNQTVARMLLRILGEDDIDELLAMQDENADVTEANLGKELRDLREMVEASRNGGSA